MRNLILQGNALEVLKTIPSGTIQCCVTSPPYWGLRDYGTATWVGGSPDCDHTHFLGGNGKASAKQVTSAGTQKYQYRGRCEKCGAVRIDNQLGLEKTPEEYVAHMVEVFREVKRCLREDGTLWLVIGDSFASGKGTCYNPGGGATSLGQNRKALGAHPLDRGNKSTLSRSGMKPKDLVGIPWRVAFALQADGAADWKAVQTLERIMSEIQAAYEDEPIPDKVLVTLERLNAEWREAKAGSWYLRSDIIWHKPNPMPESVTDRPTKSHEYIFLLSKSQRYYYDAEAVKEESVAPGAVHVAKKQQKMGAMNGIVPQHNITSGTHRNRRSVWTVSTKPFKGWGETVRWVRVASGVASGDMRRITSLSCPVHGDLSDLSSMRVYDGHGGVLVSHSAHNENHPAQVPQCDSVPIDQLRASDLLERNSGCSVPGYVLTAMLRNSQSHKMDPALVTNWTYNVFAEKFSRIVGIQGLRESCGSVGHTLLSSTLPDVMDDHLWEQISYHSEGKSSSVSPDCSCAIYEKHTEKTSHFATFPPDLIEPCIKAGTSEKGECQVCGQPIKRQLYHRCPKCQMLIPWQGKDCKACGFVNRKWREDRTVQPEVLADDTGNGKRVPRKSDLTSQETVTIWEHTCSCGRGERPQIVLDPFAGSGTTLEVAKRLGRDYIGIELNEEYIETLIRPRLGNVDPLFNGEAA